MNIRPSRIEDPLEYKMHKKVLKINIRPSYNRENRVRNENMSDLDQNC